MWFSFFVVVWTALNCLKHGKAQLRVNGHPELSPYALQPVSAAGGHGRLIAIRYYRIFGKQDGRPTDSRASHTPCAVYEMAFLRVKASEAVECPALFVPMILSEDRHICAI